MIEVRTTSGNRDLILKILMDHTGARPIYSYAPDFSYEVGGYRYQRDGRILCENGRDALGIFPLLFSLGLCADVGAAAEAPVWQSGTSDRLAVPQDCGTTEAPAVPSAPFTYPMAGHSGRTLINLIGIISARQRLINQAIGTQAFRIDPDLVTVLYDHPPESRDEFLQALYGRADQARGMIFRRNSFCLSGFGKAAPEDQPSCRQLADAIAAAALRLHWVKPFTRNVRNRKYAMRTWMNTLGMTGPDYQEARALFLGRLPGRADRRKL